MLDGVKLPYQETSQLRPKKREQRVLRAKPKAPCFSDKKVTYSKHYQSEHLLGQRGGR